MSANTTSLLDWALSTNNINTVNLINNAIGLLFSLLIFIKSYDFEACLESVRAKREAKRKEKERLKLEKFKKLLQLSKNGDIDISKVNLSEEAESSEEKIPDAVMRVARRKQKREIV